MGLHKHTNNYGNSAVAVDDERLERIDGYFPRWLSDESISWKIFLYQLQRTLDCQMSKLHFYYWLFSATLLHGFKFHDYLQFNQRNTTLLELFIYFDTIWQHQISVYFDDILLWVLVLEYFLLDLSLIFQWREILWVQSRSFLNLWNWNCFWLLFLTVLRFFLGRLFIFWGLNCSSSVSGATRTLRLRVHVHRGVYITILLHPP
jgi:hypothetical protein